MNVLIIDTQDIYINGIIYGLKNINEEYLIHSIITTNDLNMKLKKLNINVTIFDGDMSSQYLLETLSFMRKLYPIIPFVFVTECSGNYDINNYKDFTVSAVIKRSTSIENLHNVLMLVKSGIKCVSKEMILSDSYNKQTISKRKEEILRLILDGNTNKQIAKKLDISPGTVKSHIESILLTLNVPNRIKAATTYFNNEYMNQYNI